MWYFSISAGKITDPDGNFLGGAYAGRGADLDNPADENVKDEGPLPQGRYLMRPPINEPDGVGEFAIPLVPDAANQMFGRSGFYIHGDNPQMNHTASDGCIVAALPLRQRMAASSDHLLEVVE